MNSDDVIRMAREVGYPLALYDSGPYLPSLLVMLLEKAAAAEREACARVADAEAARWEKNSDGQVSVQGVAATIRARGQA